MVVYTIEGDEADEIPCNAGCVTLERCGVDVVLCVAALSDLRQIAVGTMGEANEVIVLKETG